MRNPLSGLLVLAVLALVVVPCAAGAAASADPCGDPRLVSQGYTMVPATVLAVETGDRMQVRVVAGKDTPAELVGDYAVRLVATAAPKDGDDAAQSRARLAERLLGKEIHLLQSPFQQAGTPRNVIVQAPAFEFRRRESRSDCRRHGPGRGAGRLRHRLVSALPIPAGRGVCQEQAARNVVRAALSVCAAQLGVA